MATPPKTTPRRPPPRPRPKASQEEPILRTLIKVTLILIGLGVIYILIDTSSPEKPLRCTNTGGPSSLLAFGTCTTE